MLQPQNIVKLDFLNFPQRLLIKNEEYKLDFQVTNTSSHPEEYLLSFDGKKLDIEQPKEISKEIKFTPNETKQFHVVLRPVADGQAKLIVNVTHMKRIKYTVQVQKVRDVVSISKINEIFGKEYITSADMEEIFIKEDYIFNMSDLEIQEALNKLTLPNAPHVIESSEKTLTANEYNGDQPTKTTTPLPTPEAEPYCTPEEKHEICIKLAKTYATRNEIGYALEILESIPDENEKWDIYSNLIRAQAGTNLKEAIKNATKISDIDKKENTLKNIALDLISSDPEEASRVALLIKTPDLKETLLSEILFQCIRLDPKLAIKISGLIEDLTLRILVMFEICSALLDAQDTQQVLELVRKILSALLKAKSIKMKENNFNNFDYHLFLNAVHALAELSSPQAADDYINSLADQELKEQLANDLFVVIYKIVDEERIKVDPNVVSSQYYLINTFYSKSFDKLKAFVNKDGNVSENILSNSFNFSVIITCLFGYNFSTFPFFDRIYNDIMEENLRSFGFYTFPVIDSYKEHDRVTLRSTLEYFFKKNISQLSGTIYLFNVDFIPYLTVPTIIMSSNPELNDRIQSKVDKILGNKISFVVDNGIFKGGNASEILESLFPENKFKIINLVLSYEILNNYTLFKEFIKAFM